MIYRGITMIAGVVVAVGILLGADGFAERDARYRLQSGDELEIRLRRTPEFNDKVTIQPDGFVSLAMGDDVKVRGMTVPEATDAIRTACTQRLRDPEVTVVLTGFEKPHVVISGEVKTPGKYDYRESLTVMQGIAVAGGLNPGARRSEVVLFRPVGPDLVESRLIDLKQMYDGKSLEEDVALRPGDILVIPKNKVAKLERIMQLSRLTVFVPLF